MVDEQAIIVFLRQLDRALAAASRGDEHQRRHRLAMTQSLVMAVLADPGILIGHCARRPTAWPTSPADCSLVPGRYPGQARRHAGRRWGRRRTGSHGHHRHQQPAKGKVARAARSSVKD
jgi:hypothetical protein